LLLVGLCAFGRTRRASIEQPRLDFVDSNAAHDVMRQQSFTMGFAIERCAAKPCEAPCSRRCGLPGKALRAVDQRPSIGRGCRHAVHSYAHQSFFQRDAAAVHDRNRKEEQDVIRSA